MAHFGRQSRAQVAALPTKRFRLEAVLIWVLCTGSWRSRFHAQNVSPPVRPAPSRLWRSQFLGDSNQMTVSFGYPGIDIIHIWIQSERQAFSSDPHRNGSFVGLVAKIVAPLTRFACSPVRFCQIKHQKARGNGSNGDRTISACPHLLKLISRTGT